MKMTVYERWQRKRREMNQEQQDVLEGLVDSHTLSGVLSALEIICGEKAEHLRSNWQDEKSAKVWDKAASVMGKAAFTIGDL